MDTKREDALLQQALNAARAKHELTARDLFLEVVELNPHNELAWTWLTGLLDDLDDCIYACERVLEINPGHVRIRHYLSTLQQRKQQQLGEQQHAAQRQVKQAIELAHSGQRETALGLLREAAKVHEPGVEGWRLLADLSPDMDEQMHALKKLLALAPQDAQARETLKHLMHLKRNPQEQAALYEEQGNIGKAIELYYLALRQPHLEKQWRSIEQRIVRLKSRRSENITHISPSTSIARLAAGPPVVFVFMLLIHVGINPLADPQILLWLEWLLTMLGGLMIALATVRSHHRIWYRLFRDVSQSGTPRARTLMAVVGWMLIVLPFIHLFLAAFVRMIDSFLNWG